MSFPKSSFTVITPRIPCNRQTLSKSCLNLLPQVLANLDVLIEVGQVCLSAEQHRRAAAPRALRPTVMGVQQLSDNHYYIGDSNGNDHDHGTSEGVRGDHYGGSGNSSNAPPQNTGKPQSTSKGTAGNAKSAAPWMMRRRAPASSSSSSSSAASGLEPENSLQPHTAAASGATSADQAGEVPPSSSSSAAAAIVSANCESLATNMESCGEEVPSYLALRPSDALFMRTNKGDAAREMASIAYPFPGSRRH